MKSKCHRQEICLCKTLFVAIEKVFFFFPDFKIDFQAPILNLLIAKCFCYINAVLQLVSYALANKTVVEYFNLAL